MRLSEILKEIQARSASKRYVYSLCNKYGTYDELILLNSHQITSDGEVDEVDDYFVVKYKENGEEHSSCYLERIEV